MTKFVISLTVSVCYILVLAACATSSQTAEQPEPAPAKVAEPVVMQPAEPVAVTPEPEPVAVQEPVTEETLETVLYFDFDRSTLRPEARAALTAHADRLKRNNDVVTVVGHSDERGSEDYNMSLGKRRANAVRDFLISLGVDARQIQTLSYGEAHPKVAGSFESAWEQNRRVEIK